MQRTTIATAIVLVVAGMGAGLSAVPGAAVTADCTEDFDIANSEPLLARTLAADTEETGKEDVNASEADQTLHVELVSDDDKLEFGIFEDGSGCSRSTNVGPNTCEGNVTLDTKGANSEDSQKCTLESPDSGTRNFYVVSENIEMNGDELKYKIWVE